MAQILRILATALIVFDICSGYAFADGDAVRGEQLFNRCAACHSVEGQNKSGPALNGVFGRKAGAVEGYRFSAAIVNSNVIWTDETLDAYLSGPARMLRGTRMTTSVVRPDDRSNIIAYLKTLAAHETYAMQRLAVQRSHHLALCAVGLLLVKRPKSALVGNRSQ